MSHFTVLVIGDDVDAQLAPYQENNNGDCPEELMEFNDVEEEYRAQYETDTVTKVVLEDGTMVNTWDEMFKVKGEHFFDTKTVIPSHLEQRDVPLKELFPTFDEYMSEWCGYKKDENGRYGYWENPNAKWDWYQVGGRWSGFFKVKEGSESELGEPGVFNNVPRTGYADVIRKGDVDFEGMANDYVAEQLVYYRGYHDVVAGREVPRWKDVLASCNNDVEKAREEYNNIPVIKDIHKDHFFLYEDPQDVYGMSEEEFIRKSRRQAFSTFAIVKDGKWMANGEMGWFGCHHDEEMSEMDWTDTWNEIVLNLPDDTLLTVVDCHI